MIDANKIKHVLESLLEGSDFFIVEVIVGKRSVQVYVDRPSGITIEDCILLTNKLRKAVGQEIDEFDLTVSSPGLDMPLKVPAQFSKNIGREVEVITTDGVLLKGLLHAADPYGFVLLESRNTGKKQIQKMEKRLDYSQVKRVLIIVKFK